MEAWKRHLRTASGFLDLGMALEAADEIEKIAPEDKMRPDVLSLRVYIFQAAGAWEAMEALALHLTRLQPDDEQWVVNLAYAARRCKGIDAARAILEEALTRFPKSVLIHYNLGCYACVQGRLDEAKAHLQRAFAIDERYKPLALNDPDLEAIFGA